MQLATVLLRVSRVVFSSFVFAAVAVSAAVAAPGALDLTFGGTGMVSTAFTTGDDSARAVAVQADGKIVAGGYAKSGSNYIFALVRYNANGTLDTTFGGTGKVTTALWGVDDGITGLAIQSDGKILAGGYALSGSNYVFALVRFNTDGAVDNSFALGGKVTTPIGVDSFANAMRIQTDGKIILAGSALDGSNYDVALARYNANGSLDTTFNSTGKVTTPVLAGHDVANAVAVRPDGKIVVAGYAFNGLVSNFAVLRYNANGSLDTTFDTDGKLTTSILGVDDAATGVAVQADGKVVAAGYAKNGAVLNFAVARYNTDGSLDTSFDTDGKVTTSILGGNDAATAVLIQSNGKIVVSGTAANVNDYDVAVARYNANGSLDASFDADGKVSYSFGTETDNVGYAVTLDAAGQIVIAGESGTRFMTLRLDGDRRSRFDFDGDGKTDLSIFRPLGAASEWWWLKSSTGGNAALQFGANTDRLAPVDFTGDGKTDVAFWRPSTGFWFVLRSEDFSFYSFPFGATGDVPVPADYDGDNKADAAVFRESSLTWFISRSSGGTDIVTFGAAGDKPVVADYDGDGKADIAIYRPNGAFGSEWWVRRSSNGVVFATQFGQPTDKAVPGDYTGDGKADVAFWRPSNGNWFVLRSEDFSFFAFPFGTSSDVPVPGDYDGDGKIDAAIFRPSNSTWFANQSGGGTLIQQFGITGDVPVPNTFVR